MPRYYFHIHDDDDVPDEEGAELADRAAAEARGREYALQMAAASITEHQRFYGHHRIDVANQAGETVFSVCFREVVEIRP